MFQSRTTNGNYTMLLIGTLAQHATIADEHFFERDYAIPLTEREKNIELKLKNTEQFHSEVCSQCKQLR